MIPSNAIALSIIFVLALVLFGWSCFKRFRLLILGNFENRFDNFGKRIRSVLLYAFGQRCTVSHGYRFGLNHSVLFWCFLILFLANAEFLLNGLFPESISLSRLPDGAHHTLAFIFDVVSLAALLAVCVAVVRRLAFPPSYMEARNPDSFIILGLVATLMIAFFGLHASEIAYGEAAAYRPVSNFIAATFLSGVSAASLAASAEYLWWLHAIALLGFLNYLPYSKHVHILTAIPNVFFRNLARVNIPPREEFKAGNTFGVGRVNDFTWKGLLDSYSCTECGRCSNTCPATFTGKPLNPRLVIHDIKMNLLRNGSLLSRGKSTKLPLIGGGEEGSISEEVLWECTTCSGCVEVCPVFIEQFPRIIDMRRHLVEVKARFPEELLNLFENMEQRSNPWGIAPAERIKWTVENEIKPFEASQTEYLFFVGCAGAFVARNRRTTQAIARILDAGGVSWGIMGRNEPCCADSMRRLGNEFLFNGMVEKNIELFKERGVSKVITQCPHCFSTLQNDYRQYGIELEVVHHTELINSLIETGRLRLDKPENLGKVVFHDSCYLGRHNKIYQAPRKVVASVTGEAVTEMDRHQDRSFCCGAGGGRMWMEESIGQLINVARVEEALKKTPQTICVSCPYCMTMFEDGLKDKGIEDRVRVYDVAEIAARGLK
jgi:Fe-S oxidoreductase/nitrate reductase gamma subunit